MVVFKSQHQDVKVPEDVTTWEWLFESRETSPLYNRTDKPLAAFIDAETKERLDWAQVKAKSTAISSSLVRQHGLQPHDTVTIFSTNSIWFPVCLLATSRAGGRVSGAPPAFTIDEMVYALKVAKTKIIFTLPAALDKVRAAAAQVGIPSSKIFLVQGAAEGYQNADDLARSESDHEACPHFSLPPNMSNTELCGFLNFSSGTTGLPKAVMVSHHNVIANCYTMRAIQNDPEKFRQLAIMPQFHITGIWRFCHFPIFLNGDSIVLPQFTMPKMLTALVEFQIDELICVPPILLRVARDAIVDEYDLSCVKVWGSGAAPISPGVVQDLQKRFPESTFRQAYGCTEALVTFAPSPDRFGWQYAASVGTLIPNTFAKVIDMDGKELGPNQVGELLVKGPQVAMGYLGNEKATRESFDTEGYYHTGDIAYIDEDGMAYITDRLKELIKVKGCQVAPAELEDLLHTHEHIADCAVISMPDEYSGELPKAYVVLRPGVPNIPETAQQLLNFVKANKVRYKWLVEVEFVDQIPKSPAGKILRRLLKDRERVKQQPRPQTQGKDKEQGVTLQVVELKTETDHDLEAGGALTPRTTVFTGISGFLILQWLHGFRWIRRFISSWRV